MSITIENLNSYIIKKPFIHYNLNVNKKFQQNISDNNYNVEKKKQLLSLVKDIKEISYEDTSKTDNNSEISSISNQSRENNYIKKNIEMYNTFEKLDLKISNVIDKDKYFIYKPHKKDSFIGSILSIIDVDYCSQSDQSQLRMIKEFKEKLGFDIEKNFKKMNYKRKIKKTDVQDILLNDKHTNDETHIYIGDIINKNIIIIYGMHEYKLVNEFKKRDSVILFYKNGIYCSLLNQDNKNFIDNETTNKIKKMYSQKTIFQNTNKKNKKDTQKDKNFDEILNDNNVEIFGKKNKMNTEDVYIQVTKENNKVYIKKQDFDNAKEKLDNQKEIKLIKKMKISELHTVALKYHIDIYNGTKKKLKKDLMEEIINNLN